MGCCSSPSWPYAGTRTASLFWSLFGDLILTRKTKRWLRQPSSFRLASARSRPSGEDVGHYLRGQARPPLRDSSPTRPVGTTHARAAQDENTRSAAVASTEAASALPFCIRVLHQKSLAISASQLRCKTYDFRTAFSCG